MAYLNYKLVKVTNIGDFVYKVSLNRPKKYNALNQEIWKEIGAVFDQIDNDSDCRVVILDGEGKHFCVGLDLAETSTLMGGSDDDGLDQARKSRNMFKMIKFMQQQFTNIEKCSKPVLLGIHGYALGGAIDIATCCDVRFATKCAEFSVKEVDVGLAADVGSLNRLPKVVGNMSWIKDVSLSARHFKADEALQYGLVSRVFDTRDQMLSELERLAKSISLKSPVAVQGTKLVLNYSADHSVDDSLNYVATWNMSQLFTEDIMKSGMAIMSKAPLPPFSKL